MTANISACNNHVDASNSGNIAETEKHFSTRDEKMTDYVCNFGNNKKKNVNPEREIKTMTANLIWSDH